MAKVIITLEDNLDKGVAVKAEPNFETMMKKVNSGNNLSSAEGYAISALVHIRNKAKEQEGLMKVGIPKVIKPN